MAPTNRERAAASHHRGRGMWHISNLHDVDNEKRSQIVRISQAMMQTIKNKTMQKKKALRMRILSTRSCVRLETSLTVRDETKRNGRFKPSAAGQHQASDIMIFNSTGGENVMIFHNNFFRTLNNHPKEKFSRDHQSTICYNEQVVFPGIK